MRASASARRFDRHWRGFRFASTPCLGVLPESLFVVRHAASPLAASPGSEMTFQRKVEPSAVIVQRGEDVGAERLFRMVDGDRRAEQRRKILPHINLARPAADEDRDRRVPDSFNLDERFRLGKRHRHGFLIGRNGRRTDLRRRPPARWSRRQCLAGAMGCACCSVTGDVDASAMVVSGTLRFRRLASKGRLTFDGDRSQSLAVACRR